MDFEKNIEELRKCHDKNPTLIEKEFSKFMMDMKFLSSSHNTVIQEIGIENIILGILLTGILLIGLFQIHNFMLYFFGFIFFVAGFFIGIKIKGGGIIFLFSHGGSGVAIMIGALLGEFFSSPIGTDMPNSIYFYLGVIAFLFITSIIMIIVYNLSDLVKRKKYYVDSILVLIFLGFLLAGLFPYLVKYL